MLCPECRHNTLEPIYLETINPYIDDRPHAPHNPARREVRMFLCAHCREGYYAFGHETAAEAYWRIVRDYAKD